MFYWRYSATRTFYLNEYWIFMPLNALINGIIMRKIHSYRLKMEEIRKLKELIAQYEKEQKRRRVLYLAGGLTGFSYILASRGGDTLVPLLNVAAEQCEIDQGLGFLDSERLRKIIYSNHGSKAIRTRNGKILYITASAACFIAKRYGQTLPAFPIPIGDFGLTNAYQGVRKGVASGLFCICGPIYMAVGGGAAGLSLIGIILTFALRVSFTNLDKVFTTPIDETINLKDLQPRIPNLPEVVVVNFRNKVMVEPPKPKGFECWLPEQAWLNPSCNIEPLEVPKVIDMVAHELGYDKIVNMQDVSYLENVATEKFRFSDVYDVQPNPLESDAIRNDFFESQPIKTNLRKAKSVNYLDKFADPGNVDITDTWEIPEVNLPKKEYLRTRNPDL